MILNPLDVTIETSYKSYEDFLQIKAASEELQFCIKPQDKEEQMLLFFVERGYTFSSKEENSVLKEYLVKKGQAICRIMYSAKAVVYNPNMERAPEEVYAYFSNEGFDQLHKGVAL